MKEARRIKIGDWTVSPALNLLERDGHSRKLEPRAMEVLVHLAGRPGEVVSTEELINSVWQGRVVGDGAVYQSINQLRQALGDDANGERYIQTIPKRGYRLVAPVTALRERTEAPVVPQDAHRQATHRRGYSLVGLGVLIGGALGMMFSLARVTPPEPSPRPLRRAEIPLGLVEPISDETSAHIALSRDGGHLVFAAEPAGGTRRLYHRPLNELDARPMPGTEGAEAPCFSPDGQWVAFFTGPPEAKLKKISMAGGPPLILADAFFQGGCSWIGNEWIVYGSGDPNKGRALFSIPAREGESEPLIVPSADTGHGWPAVLPDGEAVLFVARPQFGGSGPAREGGIAVWSRNTGEIKKLITGGYAPRYAPTGHVIFARAGALWAVPFDLEGLETTGDEVVVEPHVQQNSTLGSASYAFADDGLLVYVPGGDTSRVESRVLVWVDRQGRPEPLEVPARPYLHPRLSPDERWLAVTVAEENDHDVWTYHFDRDSWLPLTFESGEDAGPVWTPDSARFVFRCGGEGHRLCSKTPEASGQAAVLWSGGLVIWPDSIYQESIALSVRTEAGDYDIYLMSMGSDEAPQPLIESKGDQELGMISPDGQFIAYRSNETGQFEIFIRPFPEADGRGPWQISTDGGDEPIWGAWSPNGGELFYRNGDSIMAVAIDTEPTFLPGRRTLLFDAGDYAFLPNVPNYDVTRDGQRLLMMKATEETTAQRQQNVVVVENWFEEVNRVASAGR